MPRQHLQCVRGDIRADIRADVRGDVRGDDGDDIGEGISRDKYPRLAIIAGTPRPFLAGYKPPCAVRGNAQLAAAQPLGTASGRAKAARFAQGIMPVIRDAQTAGATSLRQIAAVLNSRGIPTARGGTWAATQVRDILARSNG